MGRSIYIEYSIDYTIHPLSPRGITIIPLPSGPEMINSVLLDLQEDKMTWYDYVRAVEIAEILRSMTPQQREYVSEGLAKWAAEASEEDCRGAAADLLRAAEVLQERSQ